MSAIGRTLESVRKTLEASSAPVAVIDIGSNSVRLVIFDGSGRNPIPIFNEKVLAGLGRAIVTTGRLHEDGVERSLSALGRFSAVIEALGVAEVHAVATAAVREAENGAEFCARAADAIRTSIRVLSGEEEARLTAQGVLSGIPDANGLVGDLGGGSLELLALRDGEVSDGCTAPLGALRLLDQSAGKIATARDTAKEFVATIPWLEGLQGTSFYAVGGAWRTLARIHMAQKDHAIRVLHQYVIKRGEAIELAQLVASQSRKSLAQINAVPSRRVDTLPYSAVVLEALLKRTKFKDVVVSAYGLREGLLFESLPESVRRLDPLFEGCRELARRLSRNPDLGAEIADWTDAIFSAHPDGETAEQRRLRRSVSWLSGIAWRANPDQRGQIAFREVVYAPFGGVDHRQRLLLGLSVFRRYEGSVSPVLPGQWPPLQPEEERRAATVGLALRLAVNLSGGASGVLPNCPLTVEAGELVLSLPPHRRGLAGEALEKRLALVAEQFGLKSRIAR